MDDPTAAYEKLLSASLSRVLDLLKFAEAKSAALLAFSAAWIVASINLLDPARTLPAGVPLALMIALPSWGLAAVLSLLAFLPKLNRAKALKETPPRPPSLLYLGDVAKMRPEDFRQELKERFYTKPGEAATDDYFNDLTDQIYAISSIAERKFRLFHWGAGAVLLALIVLAIPFTVIFGRWLFC